MGRPKGSSSEIKRVNDGYPAKPVVKALNEWREKNQYSWSDVARKLGKTKQAVNAWRSEGKRYLSMDNVLELCDKLNINIKELTKYVSQVNIEATGVPRELFICLTTEDGRKALQEFLLNRNIPEHRKREIPKEIEEMTVNSYSWTVG